MSDDPLLNKGELGPYQIEKKLGQRAMGGVYLGMHRVLEVHHAIKVIHPKLLGDTTLLERFLREARNTAKMKHMNIVQVVGADQVDGIYYLAMEFVQGKTLEQLMRNPGLSIHDAVRYIHMIANALHYAHTRNIIHRDIKPANIMVNEEDVAKLMDFGLVRDQGQPEGAESGEQLTMAGYIMGTPQYMPLEQWQGEGVDHRSDIYALGATLYVALTGKLPFPGKNAREIFRAVLTTQARDMREHNADIDEELAAVVHKAIEPEKEDRYQTAEEFALALESWWDHHPYQGTSLFMAPAMEDATAAGGRTALQTSSVRSPSSNVATRAVLTHGSTGQGSSPSSLDVTGKGKGPLIAVAVLVVVVGLAVGAFFAFGGNKPEGNGAGVVVPPPVFEVDIAADEANEALPLAVRSNQFAIPGKGDATVNGEAYEFSTALTLTPGLNELKVASTDGKRSRTLFVLFDDQAPVITIAALEGMKDNLIPTAETTYTVRGEVSDFGCGLLDLDLVLKKDNVENKLIPNDGKFDFEFNLDKDDVAIDVLATDRAGNSQSVRFWVIPDRLPLKTEDQWMPANGWVTSKNFTLSGKLNKHRGVELTVDGKPVEINEYGQFSVDLDREPGRHLIPYAAKDWLGRTLDGAREIIVDLEPPVLELSAPKETELRFESLPQQIDVKGSLDSNAAELKVNGKAVRIAEDGSFSTKVEAIEFGTLEIEVVATDPAGRDTSKSIKLDIVQQKYRLLKKNEQGYQEYERVKDGMVMVLVPGAKFKRGGGGLGDAPEVTAEVSSFLIAKYEVTNAQFAKFMTDSGVSVDEAITIRRWIVKDPDGFFFDLRPGSKGWTAAEGTENRPVVGVTWAGALAYCEWADPDGSLPSEAQWEYAARGTDGRAFPWGEDLPDAAKANRAGMGRDARSDVTKQEEGVSPFGLLNMAGNVEEWCRDWYTEGNYTRPDQQVKDPVLTVKPNAADYRVVRGGSYKSPLNRKPKPMVEEDERSNLQTYARARRLPTTGAGDLGFRPVAKPPAN